MFTFKLFKEARKYGRGEGVAISKRVKNLHDKITNLDANAKGFPVPSFFCEFDEQDMYRAMRVFLFIASNYAIKHKIMKRDNAKMSFIRFYRTVHELFGLDVSQEAQVNKILNEIEKQTHES